MDGAGQLIALSDPIAITVSIVGLIALLALLMLVRVLLRREPTPPSWRRYRLGLFVEREPKDPTARTADE